MGLLEDQAYWNSVDTRINGQLRSYAKPYQAEVVEVGVGVVKVRLPGEDLALADLQDAPVIGPMPALGEYVFALVDFAGRRVITGGAGGAAPTNPPATGAFSASIGADQTSIPDTTETVVRFNTEQFDVSGWYSTSTYRYTPQVAGYYRLSAFVTVANISDQRFCALKIRKNGTEYINLGQTHCSGSSPVACFGTQLVQANGSSDYFEITVFHNHGSSAPQINNNTQFRFTGELVGT